jgi:hypothetical protein
VNLTHILDGFNALEAALWTFALLSFLRTKVRHELPALGVFFAASLVSPAVFLILRFGADRLPISPRLVYDIYFYSWWPLYILSTLAAFFSIQQIIRSALAPLPGLSSLGVLFFRWAGFLSVVIAITAHLADLQELGVTRWVTRLLVSFALCMCLFEVSLLSLLALTSRLLGLTFRSRVFGVSLGLALLGIIQFFNLAFTSEGKNVVSGVSIGCELVTVATLMMLIFYILRPEPQRGMLAAEKASTLMRWNEIVREMGVGPPLPVERVPNFMEEVETLVERIMRNNAVEDI